VPGVSSLIKLGKFAVNKTLHPLEVAVEKTVKAYIEKNLEGTIRRSEKSLNAWFDEAHIIEMGEDIWDSVSRNPLSEYFRMLDGNDMEDFIVIGYEFWLHFRKTPYFKKIYTDLVYFFFEKYGDRELAVIAEDVGVTEKMVVDELAQTLSRGIDTALSTGYLEERIRARLENFYTSSTAAAVVAGGAAARAMPKPKKPPASRKPAKPAAKK
jgi:hypothetical protein